MLTELGRLLIMWLADWCVDHVHGCCAGVKRRHLRRCRVRGFATASDASSCTMRGWIHGCPRGCECGAWWHIEISIEGRWWRRPKEGRRWRAREGRR